jgi:hypothetical protein
VARQAASIPDLEGSNSVWDTQIHDVDPTNEGPQGPHPVPLLHHEHPLVPIQEDQKLLMLPPHLSMSNGARPGLRS